MNYALSLFCFCVLSLFPQFAHAQAHYGVSILGASAHTDGGRGRAAVGYGATIDWRDANEELRVDLNALVVTDSPGGHLIMGESRYRLRLMGRNRVALETSTDAGLTLGAIGAVATDTRADGVPQQIFLANGGFYGRLRYSRADLRPEILIEGRAGVSAGVALGRAATAVPVMGPSGGVTASGVFGPTPSSSADMTVTLEPSVNLDLMANLIDQPGLFFSFRGNLLFCLRPTRANRVGGCIGVTAAVQSYDDRGSGYLGGTASIDLENGAAATGAAE